MRLAMLAPRATVRGPIPKHTPLLVDALRRRGCEIELLPWGRRREGESLADKLLGRTRDVRRVARAVDAGGYRLVVVKTGHDWRTLARDVPLLRTLRARDRQLVVQFHGSQSHRLVAPGSLLFKIATRRLLALADGVLVLSHGERSELTRFMPRLRVFTVRNPRLVLAGNPSTLPRSRDGDKRILCVGRLIVAKGQLDLVRALPLLRRELPCRLVLAGTGPAETEIRALAADLNVADAVDLAGHVEGAELADLYRAADVFALPTYHKEGFPTVILEAMASGLPIVTTRWRGPADYLIEGENALFVPPRDPNALASTIGGLLSRESLRRDMGAANREMVRAFDPDPVADEYLTALRQIVTDPA